MTKPLPPIETIRRLLNFDPETGIFLWRARPPELFTSQRTCDMWNTRFSGKQALNTEAGNGYLYGAIFGSNYSTHRVAWYIVTGEEPVEIDHINGVRTDNRMCNLRNVDRTENCRNTARRTKRKVGVTGVTWDAVNKSWHARINRKNLGRFKVYEDAVRVRKQAEKDLGFHVNHGRCAVEKD